MTDQRWTRKETEAKKTEEDRKKIEADVEAFLAKGGKIEVVGTIVHGKEVKQTWHENKERIRTKDWDQRTKTLKEKNDARKKE